jgi:hypothetical protein
MKRQWANQELLEHWTLEVEESQLIRRKKGADHLGYALLLIFSTKRGLYDQKSFD